MIPKKLTKDDILLAAEAADAWPKDNFAEWTVDGKAGFQLAVGDARVGYG